MEQNEKYNSNVTDDRIKNFLKAYAKTDSTEQNRMFEKYFREQLKKQGFSDEVVESLHSAIKEIDFSLSKSEQIYKIRSATALHSKVQKAKDKINHKIKDLNEQGKDTKEQDGTPDPKHSLKLSEKVFAHVCTVPKSNQKDALRQELVQQLVAQGLDEKILSQGIDHIEIQNAGESKTLNFDPPKSLLDVTDECTQKSIDGIKNTPMSKDQMLDLASNPANNNGETKTLILCKLREMSEEEYKDVAHRPEMINFLGKEVCQAVEDSRKADRAAESVYESGKQTEEKLMGKDKDPNDPYAGLTDYDKEIMGMLGITDPKVYLSMSTEDLSAMGINSLTLRR